MKIKYTPKVSSEIKILPFKINDGKIYVKQFKSAVQAGFPSPADDFYEVPISLDERFLTNPESTYIVEVNGDSMYPTLCQNDLLIVKSNLKIEDNQIGIVSVNNTDFTVKRIDLTNKKIRADNKNIPEIKIEEEDTLLFLGVCKHLIRDI